MIFGQRAKCEHMHSVSEGSIFHISILLIAVGQRRSGMRTAYIHRSTEDLDEDMDYVSREFGLFVDGTTGSSEGGLHALADECLWSDWKHTS